MYVLNYVCGDSETQVSETECVNRYNKSHYYNNATS